VIAQILINGEMTDVVVRLQPRYTAPVIRNGQQSCVISSDNDDVTLRPLAEGIVRTEPMFGVR